MQKPKVNWKRVSLGLVGILVVTLASFGYVLSSTPSSTFYLSSGIYPQGADFTIWVESGIYYAKDANGFIAYSSTNSTEVLDSCTIAGTKIVLARGLFSFNYTWVIPVHGLTIEGMSADLNGEYGTVICYSGTGKAIQVYHGGFRVQKFALKNLNIIAQGNAITSSNGIGLSLESTEDVLIDHVTIRDFNGGTGISQTCEATTYSAQTVIRDSFILGNKIGIYGDGIGASNEVNTIQVMNTVIIGYAVGSVPTVGGLGVSLGLYAGGCTWFGGDIETYEIGIYNGGDYNSFIRTRTESMTIAHISITAGANVTYIFNHQFYGAGTFIVDVGTDTRITDCWNSTVWIPP